MLRLVALCVVSCGLSSFFFVVFRLALIYVLNRFVLRFVTLCAVRLGLSSCVDLCVALICVAFGCFVCCSLSFVILRCVWFVCRGLSSCVDLCVALCGTRGGS